MSRLGAEKRVTDLNSAAAFSRISGHELRARLNDVGWLDSLVFEAGAFYLMDRGGHISDDRHPAQAAQAGGEHVSPLRLCPPLSVTPPTQLRNPGSTRPLTRGSA